jgi:hypothetical protein
MSRIATFAVGAVTSAALVAGSLTTAQAAPLPAQSAVNVAGENTTVDHVRYRGYGYGYGGYRRGYGGRAAGALAAGAALGLIGGAIAASAAPRYGYYDYGYAPSYGYGYAPVRSYGYGYAPVYGGYGYGGGYGGGYYGW